MPDAEQRQPDPAADRLAELLAPARPDLARSGLLSLAAGLLWIPQAAAIGFGLGGLLGAPGLVLDPYRAAAVFAALGILRHALDALAGGRAFDAADRVVARARAELIRAESLRTPLDGGRPNSARIASLAAEKLDALRPWLLRYQPARLGVAVLPLAIAAVAATMSWVAALILLVSAPLIPLFMALVGLAARDASDRQMAEIGALNELLLERLSALVDIRLLDARGRAVAGFAAAADGLRARTMEVLRIAFLSSAVLELFAALGVAMVAVYVGFALLGEIRFGAYGTPLTVQEGIVLLMLAPDFFQPLRDFAAGWHDRAAATAVAGELAALGQSRERLILGTGAAAQRLAGPAQIETRGLAWRSPSGRLLSFPDLSIAPGDAVAILGASGAGKSTLLALLAGLAKPEAGRLTVAGLPLGDVTADAWRARLGWVGQAPHFLAATLRANLALGGDRHDEAALARALTLAQAGRVVVGLPRGLATRLGETGGGVSGGEARRLVLARAAFAAPDVLLADEPTADLDAATAAAVTDGLLELGRAGATLILATHDPALARRMDRVIALEATCARS